MKPWLEDIAEWLDVLKERVQRIIKPFTDLAEIVHKFINPEKNKIDIVATTATKQVNTIEVVGKTPTDLDTTMNRVESGSTKLMDKFKAITSGISNSTASALDISPQLNAMSSDLEVFKDTSGKTASEFAGEVVGSLDTIGTNWDVTVNDMATALGTSSVDMIDKLNRFQESTNSQFTLIKDSSLVHMNTMLLTWNSMYGAMLNTTINAVDLIVKKLNEIPTNITTTHTIITNTVSTSPITSLINTIGSGISSLGNMILGSRQFGGPISQEGIYWLHEGEYVQAKGDTGKQLSYSPTYYISGSNSDEFKKILAEHDRQLMSNISRMKLPGV
jgi:hypothetical protein